MRNRIGGNAGLWAGVLIGALGVSAGAVVRVTAQQPPPDTRAKQIEMTPAPDGATVLFSGKPDDVAKNWRRNFSDKDASWKVTDGALTAGGGDIVTKGEFTDFRLHVEFKVPYMPGAHGQERGNSGIGLQSHYEIQVLDSAGFQTPGKGDCGAVYNQAAPLVNACKPPLSWESYDIIFRAPRFDNANKRTEKARVTVLLNNILVQNNTEIEGPTGIGGDRPVEKPGPIQLQDHGVAVQYRNIWIVPLPAQGSSEYGPR